MNYFKKMKANIRFQLISICVCLVVCITLGVIFTLVFNWDYAYAGIILSGIIYTILTLKLSAKKYDELRKSSADEAFKEVNSVDTLTFDFRENHPIDIFEYLGLDKRTPMYYINSTIKGTMDDVRVLSFSAKYRPYNTRAMINSRIYCLKFNKNIKKCHLDDFKHDNISKATVDKVLKFKGDEVYISLGGSNRDKNYFFQLEPIAYKTYDLYMKRMKSELDFINYLIKYIKENCLAD